MKEQFLAGFEVTLDDTKDCLSFIKTHITTKKNCLFEGTYIHLIYDEKDFLTEVKSYVGNKQIQPVNERYIDRIQKLESGIGKLQYRDCPTNILHHFTDDTNGIHSIGGKRPKEFLTPENNWSIQYFGKISNQDPVFQWLPFDLHIIYPHFYEIDWLVLDYSNPLSPCIQSLKALR